MTGFDSSGLIGLARVLPAREKIIFFLIVIFAGAALISCGPEVQSGNGSEAAGRSSGQPIRRSDSIHFSCTTATQVGSQRFSYETSSEFNNLSGRIAMRLLVDNVPRAGFEVTKLGSNKWEKKGGYTVELGMKRDGSKSLRVYNHALRHEAGMENGHCRIIDRFSGCPANQTEVNGVCQWTGQAPIAGEFDIAAEVLASIIAGPVVSGVRGLVQRGALSVWSASKTRSFVLMAPDRVVDANRGLVANFSEAVLRQLDNVNSDAVEKLAALASDPSNAGRYIPTGEVVGGMKTLTLGTAREFTRRTGLEVALLWDPLKKVNVIKIGDRKSVDIGVSLINYITRWFTKNQKRLIYHTHPTHAIEDSTMRLIGTFPSKADVRAVWLIRQEKSFILPSDIDQTFINVFEGRAFPR